jgi:GNAT superfamily N-acetyltransferase
MTDPQAAKIRFEGLDPTRHHYQDFRCSEAELTDFLHQRAVGEMQNHLSAVFVGTALTAPAVVRTFYTLSAASVRVKDLPSELSARFPYPAVPCALLGRMAVHADEAGQGLGALTLMDALWRVAASSAQVGTWALIVDAKHRGLLGFYRKYGFTSLPNKELRLFLPIATILAVLGEP